MKNDSWIGRWMAPIYGKVEGIPDVVYAPTLEYAFKLARTMWPTADGWTCLGRQDPKDPEVCLPHKAEQETWEVTKARP